MRGAGALRHEAVRVQIRSRGGLLLDWVVQLGVPAAEAASSAPPSARRRRLKINPADPVFLRALEVEQGPPPPQPRLRWSDDVSFQQGWIDEPARYTDEIARWIGARLPAGATPVQVRRALREASARIRRPVSARTRRGIPLPTPVSAGAPSTAAAPVAPQRLSAAWAGAAPMALLKAPEEAPAQVRPTGAPRYSWTPPRVSPSPDPRAPAARGGAPSPSATRRWDAPTSSPPPSRRAEWTAPEAALTEDLRDPGPTPHPGAAPQPPATPPSAPALRALATDELLAVLRELRDQNPEARRLLAEVASALAQQDALEDLRRIP